jgi:hypothetical protein
MNLMTSDADLNIGGALQGLWVSSDPLRSGTTLPLDEGVQGQNNVSGM